MYTMEFCPSEVIKKYYVTVTKEHFISRTKPRFVKGEFQGTQKHLSKLLLKMTVVSTQICTELETPSFHSEGECTNQYPTIISLEPFI